MFKKPWSFWGQSVSSLFTRRHLRAMRRQGKRQRKLGYTRTSGLERWSIQALEPRMLLSGVEPMSAQSASLYDITPDLFVEKITDQVVAAPEISVIGDNVSISDGDFSPSVSDNTNFGARTYNEAFITHIFVVRNTGTSDISLSSLSVPDGYSIVKSIPVSIAAGEEDTFSVSLTANQAGIYTGQISFITNDSNENPFNFSITGTVTVPEPEIEIRGNSIVITDGDSTPSASDYTNFGTLASNASNTHSFAVRNIGVGDLNVSSITVPEGYSIVDSLWSTIAPGEEDTFTVAFTATVAGTYTGQIRRWSPSTGWLPVNTSSASLAMPTPCTT
jgi:hypothetical protein